MPLAERARIEHDLTIGDDEQALATLGRMTEALLATGEIESFEQWNPWTAQVVSLFLRADEVGKNRGWNENTPGLTDLIREMQNLLDKWFLQSEGVIQGLTEKCIQGEIEYGLKAELISRAGTMLSSSLKLDRADELAKWYDNISNLCANLGITWQANVVTTGKDFISDISVGSEAQFVGWDVFHEITDLEVEYVNGFWLDTCVPTSGSVSLGYFIDVEHLNLSSEISMFDLQIIKNIMAFVRIVTPVYIDCSPAGFKIDADAQAPFHGKALERINNYRMNNGTWEFELEYDPGGGVVAQLEEGPKKLSFPDGEYELWQLVSLYQNTPAN